MIIHAVSHLMKASRPAFSVMGASRDVPGAYEDVRRHPSARPIPGAHLHDRAARLLRRSGAIGDGAACQVFPTLDSAVRWARPGQPAER